MSEIREILSRKIDINTAKGKQVLAVDMQKLFNYLDMLTPYPWTPKKCTQIKRSTDLEFISRSPELVELLASVILHLLQEEEKAQEGD